MTLKWLKVWAFGIGMALSTTVLSCSDMYDKENISDPQFSDAKNNSLFVGRYEGRWIVNRQSAEKAEAKLDSVLVLSRLPQKEILREVTVPYRRFTLTLLNSFKERVVDNIIWVESVGSGAGPFSPWLPLPPPDTYLQSCHIGKNCIFGYPDFYEIDENDVTKGVSSKHFVENESNIIFDLLGRRLITPPSHGIYIRDGRKYVR